MACTHSHTCGLPMPTPQVLAHLPTQTLIVTHTHMQSFLHLYARACAHTHTLPQAHTHPQPAQDRHTHTHIHTATLLHTYPHAHTCSSPGVLTRAHRIQSVHNLPGKSWLGEAQVYLRLGWTLDLCPSAAPATAPPSHPSPPQQYFWGPSWAS